MSKKRIALVGGGFTGTLIGRELIGLKDKSFSRLAVADLNREKAKQLVAELEKNNPDGIEIQARQVDLSDEQATIRLMEDADVVVNITRPYEKTAVKTMSAAIKAGVNYVDINASFSALQDALQLDDAARAAGITALISFGDIPGLLNVFAKHGAMQFDSVEEIHLAIIGVISAIPRTVVSDFMKHFWVNMFAPPAIIYRDGRYVEAAAGSEKELISVPGFSGAHEVMLARHAELATLPRFIPGVKLITFKAGFAPAHLGNDILCSMFKWGMDSSVPVDVRGTKIVPSDFAVAFLSSDAHANAIRIADAPAEKMSDGMQVKVLGDKNGMPGCVVYSYADPSHGTLPGTCALAAQLLCRGDITTKGVLAPEALDPKPFLTMAQEKGIIVRETREMMW